MEKQTSWHEDWPSPQGMALSLCIHTQIQMEKSPFCTKISLIDRKKQPSWCENLPSPQRMAFSMGKNISEKTLLNKQWPNGKEKAALLE